MTIGRVHSIETASTHDGPGMRYVVFMQGCKMRCLYCHNRDTWDISGGEPYQLSTLIDELCQLKHFYMPNQGGLTATGGEPLLQAPFIKKLFQQTQALGLTTCLDTSGFADVNSAEIQEVLQYTDLVLLDIKHMQDQAHRELTGVSNKATLAFARYLNSCNIPMIIRYVVLPTINDNKQQLEQLALFLTSLDNLVSIELLPYHEMGKYKWQHLNKQYALTHLKPPSLAHMKSCQSLINNYSLNVVI